MQVLAHLGPVVGLSVDPSQGGRYMATAGRDGTVKVWDCRNWKGAVRDWSVRSGGDVELEWSAKGSLAVANGGCVNVRQLPAPACAFNVPRMLTSCIDLHDPVNTHPDGHQSTSAAVPDTPDPTPPTNVGAVRAIPRYLDDWPRSGALQHPGTGRRGAQF